MPIAVALFVRSLIQFAVTYGIIILAEKYLLPYFNKGIETIITKFGVDEETAKDIMANEVIQFAESVGIGALTLRTKLPIKISERLGFSSKGFVKRSLDPKVAAKLPQSVIANAGASVATAEEVQVITEVVSKTRGLNVGIVGSLWKSILSNVSASAVIILALANVMDFGNWQGAYQKTFQKIFTFFGFPPDSPMPKARTLSAETWSRIYHTIEIYKPVGLSFPWSGIDKPYSRDALADLTDEVAANLIKDRKDATFKNVIGVLLPLIQLTEPADPAKLDSVNFTKVSSFSGGGNSQNTASGTTTGGITTLSAYYASKGKSLPSIIDRGKIYESLGLGKITYYTGTAEQNTKLLNALLGQGINNGLALTPNGNNTNNQQTQVITGILSQGTLGNTVDFISRQDDLIENATELEHAMRNNLAPFLTTIPSRVSYEVRIVSSITTATGFQTKGTVQKVLTGYTTKGIPKYKNVYNKFAILDLKIKTATGSLAKLATIVLGPVDAVKFQAQNIDLSGIAQTIQNNIIAPISSVVETPKVSNVMQSGEAKDMTIQDIVKKGYTIDQAYRLIGGPNHNNGANYVAFYGNIEAAANAFGFKPDLNRQSEPMTVEYITSLGYTSQEAQYIINGGSAYLDPTNPLYTGVEPN